MFLTTQASLQNLLRRASSSFSMLSSFLSRVLDIYIDNLFVPVQNNTIYSVFVYLMFNLYLFSVSDTQTAWSTLRKIVTVFLVLSFFGALIADDKSGVAGAAISSRLGMGNTVRQAEDRLICR